jgi:hypothetical protein
VPPRRRAALCLSSIGSICWYWCQGVALRVAGNPIARRVKLADLADNLANNRRLEPTAQNRAPVERYERAQARLLAP